MKLHPSEHIHRRKAKEPYPHPKKWVRFLDKTVLAAAILGPLTTIPQIYDIYVFKEVAGLSLLTWNFWQALSIPWLLYGIIHKEAPIIVSSILWIAVQTTVIIGIILYS